jgi:hypothetical protein
MDYLRADYKRWINADSWTVERAILLLINAEILPKDNGIYDCGPTRTMTEQSDFNKFMEIWPILESSLKYGGLKKLDKGCVGLWNDVNPIDFIRWAKLKGYLIPGELKVIDTGTQDETVDDACKGSYAETEPKPREGGYKLRDDFAIQQVKDKPELLKMRAGMIKIELRKASNLFISGYSDWWRSNPIFPKSEPGRNSK